MIREWFFIAFGYLSGSILFANIAARITGKEDMLTFSKDGNPGTANAFQHGGFWCGVITLLGDLLKAFLPVWLYIRSGGDFTVPSLLSPLVLAAPVLGHIFPIYMHFHGGKGIATSFGSLLGLAPQWMPVLILAGGYLFFSLVLRIVPHFYRTITTFSASSLLMLLLKQPAAIFLGFLLIAAGVILRHVRSAESRSEWKVRFLWM